jgi:hypothetical protein
MQLVLTASIAQSMTKDNANSTKHSHHKIGCMDQLIVNIGNPTIFLFKENNMTWREASSKFIRDITRVRTIREIIAKELREAHVKKLEAESAVEYAVSIVQYNERRIKRLEQRLTEHTQEGDYT